MLFPTVTLSQCCMHSSVSGHVCLPHFFTITIKTAGNTLWHGCRMHTCSRWQREIAQGEHGLDLISLSKNILPHSICSPDLILTKLKFLPIRLVKNGIVLSVHWHTVSKRCLFDDGMDGWMDGWLSFWHGSDIGYIEQISKLDSENK